MSHELTIRENGQVEFAYLERDGMPWHGLGTAMQPGATFEQWQQAAGMDWRIHRSKVRYATCADAQPNEYIEVPTSHVLFRSDNKEHLGIVSDRYQVVQPAAVLDFFRDIAHAGGLELSAAGTIYGGKRFWATAKFGEASPAALKDKLRGFLLISTSADGSLATDVRRVTERVVCRNTLAIALSEKVASVRVTHRSKFDPTSVKEFMGLNEVVFDSFIHKLERLANTDLKLEQAENMAVAVLGGEQDKVRTTAGFNKVMELFSGSGLGAKEDGVYGTAWGFVNAFTEYADHWVRSRTNENRLVSAQWGAGSQLKQRALEIAESV